MTFKIFKNYSLSILVLPLLYLLLYFYLMDANGPFYLSRIDPDYVYLLNGMNSAVLNFDRIGHTDHPGTPFQLFLGCCIQFIYLLSGEGGVVKDLLSRPEHYMIFSSHILAVIFFVLLVWSGKIALPYAGNNGAYILQLTPFVSPVIPDLSVRIMPDRFGISLVFLLLLLLIKWTMNSNKISNPKIFIIGLITGLCVAVKINFIAIIPLPLFVLPKKLIQIGGVLLGFLLGITPIINRFSDFSIFIERLIRHDGMYGSGSEQIFNWDILASNLKLVAQINPLLVFLFLASILAFGWFRRNQTHDKSSYLFFLGFSLVCALGVFMVIKHFKNYYLAPVLIMLGSMLFFLYKSLRETNLRFLPLIAAIVSSLFCLREQQTIATANKIRTQEREKIVEMIDTWKPADDLWLITPEWLWGPSPAYGLIFGFSYVRHRDRYSEVIEEVYPKTLSYEGPDNPPRLMRVATFSEKELQKPGNQLIIFDQEGRRANDLILTLQDRYHYEISDSLPINKEEFLIRLQVPDSSKTLIH